MELRICRSVRARMYSKQVQQQTRIQAYRGGPLWTAGCWLTCTDPGCKRTCQYLGVKGSRVQIPPSRLFFERFFAMYSSSTAVPEEDS
jgi:hypothetical protein